MNLYTIVTGCYSYRSETWYSHEQEFTQAEFNELLEREWRATRAKLAGLFYARDIECQEWFGVEIDSIDWIFESCDSTLLEDPKTLAALKHGSLEQLKAFGIKYRDTFDATIDVLMRDAGFTEVTANAQLWLSHYPWDRTELDAFEKELRHETAKGAQMIDSRVEFLFQLVLALPSGPTQQRALAAALKVADAKSRLHALQEAEDCVDDSGNCNCADRVERLREAASVAVREAVAAAHGAPGQEGGQA